MSLIKVAGNASGTGTLTVQAPNTNTNYTLNLPAATGTFNISGLANEVPAGSASSPSIYPTGDTNTGIFFPAADTIAFAEGGAEAMRIDSSGRMLVGSTTARANLFNSTITSPLQVEGTGNDTSSTLVVRNSNDTGGPFYILAKTRGTTVGSNTVVQADDFLGSIRFQGSDGTEFVDAAMIQVQVGGTPGANDMPGTMIFYTTADGSASPTERARIPAAGGFQCVNSISVGNATPTTSGAGITFPATQSASSDANTLDDYEEGTWTPTYYGASTAGTTTYSTQNGSYVKVGSVVTINMFLTLTAATGSGAIRIGGLPFSIGTVSGGSAPVMVEQYNWSAGTYLVAYLETGQSFLRIFACADDVTWSEQSVTNETQSWVISVSYRST